MAKALTVKALEAIKPTAARKEVPDGLVSGLYLVVQPSGARSWAVRYRHNGAPRKLTLGTFPAIELKAARDLASKALVAAAGGADPAGDKRAARQATGDDIETVVKTFIERHAKANAARSWPETKRILDREIVGAWRGRKLADVTRRDVHALLDKIVDRGSPIAANRTLAAFRKLCAWAVERDIIATSPCQGVTPPAAERSRDRVLSDDELVALWRACGKIDWPFGPLVRLLVLTGARRDEVGCMRWSEIDLTARTWTIPKERAKNGAEHIVYLSSPAVAILEALPRVEGKAGYVFTTSGIDPVSGFSRAKDRLDTAVVDAAKAAAEADKREFDADAATLPAWTFHDIRRSFATGCAGLGIALPVIEKALNHVSGTFAGIVGVYNRHSFATERRSAMDTWARHVETLLAGPAQSNVIPLQRAAVA